LLASSTGQREGTVAVYHLGIPGRRVGWNDAASCRPATADALELGTRGDVELGEDLARVALGGAGADVEAGADLKVGQPLAGSLGDLGPCSVSSLRVSSLRLRAVSPVTPSSRRARSANACMPISPNMSCALRRGLVRGSSIRCFGRWKLGNLEMHSDRK
jgi:hypothetical protein